MVKQHSATITHEAARRTYRMAQRQRFPLARHDRHDLPAVQHRRDAHRQCHPGHLGDIVPKEPGVREDGVVRERLDARARGERRPGLVERDVAVLADPAEEELDPAVRDDLGFVCFAFPDEVFGVPVEDVDLRRRDVDCRARSEVRRMETT